MGYPVLLSINMHQIPKTRLLTPPLPPQLRKRRQRRQRKLQRLLQLNLRPKRRRLLKKRKKRRKQKNKVSQILSSTSIHKSTNQIQKMVFLLYSTIQSYWKKENISFPFKHEETLPYLIR